MRCTDEVAYLSGESDNGVLGPPFIMAPKHLTIQCSALLQMEFFCPKCGVGFVFDVKPILEEGHSIMQDCFFCGKPFLRDINPILEVHRDFYKKASGSIIQFRVEVPQA